MSDKDLLNEWLRCSAFQVRRRIRLLMLLDAADYAVIAPMPSMRMHAFAFLAEVLSPVFDVAPLTGRLLKRGVGPYFPDLQWEVDRLIGLGLVEVSDLHAVVEETEALLGASFALARARTSPVLHAIYSDPYFFDLRDLLRELAASLGAIEEGRIDGATRADATWYRARQGSVVDYAEWRASNLSSAGAERIQEITSETWGSGVVKLPPAARISLYVNYMRRAANA